MKRPWLVYLVTALAACGAAVAIVGLPDRGGADSVASPAASTSTTAVTSTSAPVAAATTSTTTTVSTSTTTPPTSTSSTSTSSTTTSVPSTTPAPSTTAAPATTSEPPGPPPIAEITVVVANGAGVEGLAGSAAALLRDAGFVDVTAANTAPAGASVVYHDDLDAAAATILDELGLPDGSVGSRADAPAVDAAGEFDIVVVLGADRIP